MRRRALLLLPFAARAAQASIENGPAGRRPGRARSPANRSNRKSRTISPTSVTSACMQENSFV